MKHSIYLQIDIISVNIWHICKKLSMFSKSKLRLNNSANWRHAVWRGRKPCRQGVFPKFFLKNLKFSLKENKEE